MCVCVGESFGVCVCVCVSCAHVAAIGLSRVRSGVSRFVCSMYISRAHLCGVFVLVSVSLVVSVFVFVCECVGLFVGLHASLNTCVNVFVRECICVFMP